MPPPRLAPGVYNDIAPPALSFRGTYFSAHIGRGLVLEPTTWTVYVNIPFCCGGGSESAFPWGNVKVIMQNAESLFTLNGFYQMRSV